MAHLSPRRMASSILGEGDIVLSQGTKAVREDDEFMKDSMTKRPREAWAYLRFTVIGHLLMKPPARGELQEELRLLADKIWIHPVTGEPRRFGVSSIERWYYQTLRHPNPVEALMGGVRKDAGICRSMGPKLKKALVAQHQAHLYWSYRLHFENLVALAEEEDEKLGSVPSYSTVRRYMVRNGLRKQRKPRNAGRPGCQDSRERKESREMRSFEVEHALALVHLDFHAGSRKVLLPDGSLATPQLFACLDDHTRVVLHVQWYLDETAETLVHGLSQAFLKRGLPRALLFDNGAAMKAAELLEGLERLSITAFNSLAYCPEQNGKQEHWWKHIEERVLPMLEGVEVLTLEDLNEVTLAYTEVGYHHTLHEELGTTPMERYQVARSVGRPSPSLADLQLRFSKSEKRGVRRTDGSVPVLGKRYEIPSAYRHLRRVSLRFARWDLTQVYLEDHHSGEILCRLAPQDKAKNADGRRRAHVPVASVDVPGREVHQPVLGRARDQVAPLLRKYLREYAATGAPPAYLPKHETRHVTGDGR